MVGALHLDNRNKIHGMEKIECYRVGVLLAAYNGMKWIKEQVVSILDQKDVDVTLFISVDCSSDGTDRWVAELAASNPNVVMLPYGQRFGSAGQNFFRLVCDVDFSSFEMIAFADQDDVWFPEKLKCACSLIDSGKCDVVSSDVIAFWPNGKEKIIKKSYRQKKYDHFFEAAGPGCTYVFRKAAIQDFKKFLLVLGDKKNSVVLHDWLAYAFCRNRGYIWFIDSHVTMRYRQHSDNQVGTNVGIKAFYKRFEMVRQHWYRTQVENIANCVDPAFGKEIESYFFRLKNVFFIRRRPRDVFVLILMFLFCVY